MKRLLIVGDSFFTSDTINRPEQHFSEMFGEDIAVTNYSMPGITNTAIVGQMLYGILEQDYDYVILGFTAPTRMPLNGQNKAALSDVHFQWRSTSLPESKQEQKIIDDFFSIVGYEELHFNSMYTMLFAFQQLSELSAKTKFAWTAGGMKEALDAGAKEVKSSPIRYVSDCVQSYRRKHLSKDLWKYSPLKDHDPIWHIDDVLYQREVAEEFKQILRIK